MDTETFVFVADAFATVSAAAFVAATAFAYAAYAARICGSCSINCLDRNRGFLELCVVLQKLSIRNYTFDSSF